MRSIEAYYEALEDGSYEEWQKAIREDLRKMLTQETETEDKDSNE